MDFIGAWGNPSGAIWGAYDDDVDEDRSWGVGFQSGEEYDPSGGGEQWGQGAAIPAHSTAHPITGHQQYQHLPYSVPQQAYSQAPHNLDSSSNQQQPDGHGGPVPSQPNRLIHSNSQSHTDDSSRMTTFTGSRLYNPRQTASTPSLSSSTSSLHPSTTRHPRPEASTPSVTDEVLGLRLHAPLHTLSGPPADTLGVSRSRRSTQRIAQPYELNLRSAKSSQPMSRQLSTANSASSSGSFFRNLAALSDSQSMFSFTDYIRYIDPVFYSVESRWWLQTAPR